MSGRPESQQGQRRVPGPPSCHASGLSQRRPRALHSAVTVIVVLAAEEACGSASGVSDPLLLPSSGPLVPRRRHRRPPASDPRRLLPTQRRERHRLPCSSSRAFKRRSRSQTPSTLRPSSPRSRPRTGFSHLRPPSPDSSNPAVAHSKFHHLQALKAYRPCFRSRKLSKYVTPRLEAAAPSVGA